MWFLLKNQMQKYYFYLKQHNKFWIFFKILTIWQKYKRQPVSGRAD